MPFNLITSPHTRDLASALEAGVRPDHLVLVGSQLLERTIRRRLQAVIGGPAPDVRVLASWLEEQAVLWDADDPGVVLGPKDLELLLDHWLSTRDDTVASLRYPDMIAALSGWMAQASRGGLDIRSLSGAGSGIERVMGGFADWLAGNGYRIRESLAGATDTSRYGRVWLYQVDHLYPVQLAAIQAFKDNLTVLLCVPESTTPCYVDAQLNAWGATVPDAVPEPPAPRMEAFPTPQDEVRAVMERLLDRMAADSGFTLNDAVVLVSDLAEYRPHIETMGRLYGVPVRCSKTDTLRSNPVLTRFNRLLRLRLNGFQMTEIMEVFGDKLIHYPGLDVSDLRTIYAACLKRNAKTLGEADTDRLSGLAAMYGVSTPRPISGWCDAHLELLRRFRTESNQEVRTRLSQFAELLREFSATYQRLGLDPVVTESAFFNQFDHYLSGKSERAVDKPDALLFTEIHHYPDVHGKLVIVIGLADSLHPGRSDQPALNRFGADLGRWTDPFTPDPFLEARHHLERILQGAGSAWLSHPTLIADARSTPGMLWVDTMARFKAVEPWPAVSGRIWDLTAALSHSGDPLALLVAEIGAQRRSLEEVGPYDGILTHEYARRLALARIMKDDVLPMSASRLERYATAPIDFLFQYVMSIPEDVRFRDDADVRVKGNVLHEILCEFHTLGLWPDADNMEECVRRIRGIADKVMDKHVHELGATESPFPAMFRQQVHALLPAILKGESERFSSMDLLAFRPKLLEWKWSFEREVEGLTVRLNGYIDRVDVAPDGSEAVVIDYKSGSGNQPTIDRISDGLAYQMALYWWALKELGLRPILAAYWKIPIQKGKAGMVWQDVMVAKERIDLKRKRKSVLPIDELDGLVDTVVRQHMPQLIADIQNGRFPLPLKKEEYPSPYALARRFDESTQLARIGGGADMEEVDENE